MMDWLRLRRLLQVVREYRDQGLHVDIYPADSGVDLVLSGDGDSATVALIKFASGRPATPGLELTAGGAQPSNVTVHWFPDEDLVPQDAIDAWLSTVEGHLRPVPDMAMLMAYRATEAVVRRLATLLPPFAGSGNQFGRAVSDLHEAEILSESEFQLLLGSMQTRHVLVHGLKESPMASSLPIVELVALCRRLCNTVEYAVVDYLDDLAASLPATNIDIFSWLVRQSASVEPTEVSVAASVYVDRIFGATEPSQVLARVPLNAADASQQQLADRIRALGADDPETLTTRQEIAHWRGTQVRDNPAKIDVAGTRAGSYRRIAHLLQDAYEAAQWDGFATIYRQMVRVVRNREGAYLPTELSDRLAATLSGLLPSYPDMEMDFVEHALAIMGNIDDYELFDQSLMQAAYLDRNFLAVSTYNGPPLPPPMQSIVETLRRLRDANGLRRALTGIPTAAVIGGSIGYAPFYRVFGNSPGRPASDLDIMLVVKDTSDLVSAAKRIANLPGTDPASAFDLEQRAQIFVDNYSANDTIISHKLSMWSAQSSDPMMAWIPAAADYSMNLHIFTVPTFHHVLVESSVALQSDRIGTNRTLTDYRQDRPKREDHQRTLAGGDHYTPSVAEEAISGILLKSRVYYIDVENRYCPGLIQAILLTPRELRWDDLDLRPAVERFKVKIARRLSFERSARPNEHQYVSLAHIRHPYFAPHVRKAFDDQFEGI